MKHGYKHLDNDPHCQVKITPSMDELAKLIDDVNYGTQRFLSSLVDYRRIKYKTEGWGVDKFGLEIERLLNEGYY